MRATGEYTAPIRPSPTRSLSDSRRSSTTSPPPIFCSNTSVIYLFVLFNIRRQRITIPSITCRNTEHKLLCMLAHNKKETKEKTTIVYLSRKVSAKRHGEVEPIQHLMAMNSM